MGTPTLTPEVLAGTTITCSSTGGNPAPTYQWLDSDGTVLSSAATVPAPAVGVVFNWTCVATSTHNGRECVRMNSFSGTAVAGRSNLVVLRR